MVEKVKMVVSAEKTTYIKTEYSNKDVFRRMEEESRKALTRTWKKIVI